MTEVKILGGRYTVGPLIGVGGMGNVYQGYDTITGKPIAIKFLKPEIVADSLSFVEHFTREGEALRRLNHPNILKILATIEENGVYGLVTEYVSGGSLRDLLKNDAPLPVERVVNIAIHVADALALAHSMKIIHRDIKPANVLLTDDDTPRLTDFGIAYIGDRTRITQSGSLIGTYAYTSPEACMGEQLDERADIWSFGVMLYEMLARQLPFEGNSPAAIITAILQKPVPDLQQIRPDVPTVLARLIYAMLEKERDKRIASMQLVGTQLAALIKTSDTAISIVNVTGTLISPPLPTSAPLRRTQRNYPTEPFKRVVGVPRIFISYRREDGIAVTERLYDRLLDAYGESYVFKDVDNVDNIPAGANFRRIVEDEITKADIMLVIIGDHWTTAKNAQGKPLLDDPDDFVRIEVAAALRRQDIQVIPVLVNNAAMPSVEALPAALHDLAFRNAAILRNDPDFNRDAQRLVDQISMSIVPNPHKWHPKWRIFTTCRPHSKIDALAQIEKVSVIYSLVASSSGIAAMCIIWILSNQIFTFYMGFIGRFVALGAGLAIFLIIMRHYLALRDTRMQRVMQELSQRNQEFFAEFEQEIIALTHRETAG